jgi:hypothetical protein
MQLQTGSNHPALEPLFPSWTKRKLRLFHANMEFSNPDILRPEDHCDTPKKVRGRHPQNCAGSIALSVNTFFHSPYYAKRPAGLFKRQA